MIIKIIINIKMITSCSTRSAGLASSTVLSSELSPALFTARHLIVVVIMIMIIMIMVIMMMMIVMIMILIMIQAPVRTWLIMITVMMIINFQTHLFWNACDFSKSFTFFAKLSKKYTKLSKIIFKLTCIGRPPLLQGLWWWAETFLLPGPILAQCTWLIWMIIIVIVMVVMVPSNPLQSKSFWVFSPIMGMFEIWPILWHKWFLTYMTIYSSAS